MEASGGPSGGGTGTGDCEGEDQEDSSSSSIALVEKDINKLQINNNTHNGEEDPLSSFREQWQQELNSASSPQRQVPTVVKETQEPEFDNDIDKAKHLFLLGIALERSGQLYEAVRHYRRAVALAPDVERMLNDSEPRALTDAEEQPEPGPGSSDSGSGAGGAEAGAPDRDGELYARLQRRLARRGRWCEPEHPQKASHISCLPYELVLQLLRWVVGSELDAAALERAGRVCRGLYLAARDRDLWRSLCLRTWGLECGSPHALGFPTWRHMFVARPRLLLHGCYISRTSYSRPGDRSFQDSAYQPWHRITYYRYLRFYPDGLVLMWTTPDEPAACVPLMRRSGPHALRGHYRLAGDKVIAVIKKRSEKKPPAAGNSRFRARRRDSAADAPDQTFHLELELRAARSRRNWQLHWLAYAASSRRQRTPFDLAAATFPPFSFSRVRQYTAASRAPLQ